MSKVKNVMSGHGRSWHSRDRGKNWIFQPWGGHIWRCPRGLVWNIPKIVSCGQAERTASCTLKISLLLPDLGLKRQISKTSNISEVKRANSSARAIDIYSDACCRGHAKYPKALNTQPPVGATPPRSPIYSTTPAKKTYNSAVPGLRVCKVYFLQRNMSTT